MEPGHWKVSEVAERARVTVRTLHHYDEIGLLVPSRRTMERGAPMSSEEIMAGFDAFANAPEEVRSQQNEHGPEVRERWGKTDAYRESMRRAQGFTKADWAAIKGAEALREHGCR